MGPIERILAALNPYAERLVHYLESAILNPIGIATEQTSWVWIFIAFMIARQENWNWVTLRSSETYGQSGPIGAFIDLSSLIAMVFCIGFVAALGYDQGWQAAVSFAVLAAVITLVWGIVSKWLYDGKAAVMWIAGTVAVWIGIYLLADEVSWFGNFVV